MNLESFKSICETTFEDYKEPYITDNIKNIDDTLNQYSKDVFTIYNKKHNANIDLNSDLEFSSILADYNKKLRIFYSNL